MVDVVDAETRSKMMSNIGGKDTKPELGLRRALHARGFRYRLHDRRLPGRPDLVFPKYRAVVFVHGCFWHRHEGCRYATMPATRREFWASKFDANVERAARQESALRAAGWRLAIAWECSLKRSVEKASEQIANWLIGDELELTI